MWLGKRPTPSFSLRKDKVGPHPVSQLFQMMLKGLASSCLSWSTARTLYMLVPRGAAESKDGSLNYQADTCHRRSPGSVQSEQARGAKPSSQLLPGEGKSWTGCETFKLFWTLPKGWLLSWSTDDIQHILEPLRTKKVVWTRTQAPSKALPPAQCRALMEPVTGKIYTSGSHSEQWWQFKLAWWFGRPTEALASFLGEGLLYKAKVWRLEEVLVFSNA